MAMRHFSLFFAQSPLAAAAVLCACGSGGKTSGFAPDAGSNTFDASTDEDRPQTKTSSAFNRGGDPFPGLSPDGQASLITFSFSAKDNDVLDTPVRTPDGFNVVELKQRRTHVSFRNATNKIPGGYEIAYRKRGILHARPQAGA